MSEQKGLFSQNTERVLPDRVIETIGKKLPRGKRNRNPKNKKVCNQLDKSRNSKIQQNLRKEIGEKIPLR